MSSANKLDFVQGVSLLPWEWNNLGAVFGSSKENNQCVAARCNFVVRKGFDEVEQTQYGNVLEGLGDVGFNLRAKQYAFHISASNLSYKQGTDAPLRAQSMVGNALAGLKLAYAQEISDDRFVAISYDLKQKKPELSIAWAGDTFSEKASLAVTVDPVDRAMRVRAAAVFPGPEWRDDVYNEDTRRLELVQVDPSSRHTVWVEHELRRGQLMASTKAGARMDLGRLANLAGNFIDNRLEEHIPLLFWKVPLARRVYEWAIPAPNREQMRYNIKGWALEFAHDFDQSTAGPVVGISKKLGSSSTTLAATCDTGSKAVGLELRAKWMLAAVRLARQEDGAWRNPTMQLLVQPLGFL